MLRRTLVPAYFGLWRLVDEGDRCCRSSWYGNERDNRYLADRGFCAKPVTYANKSSSITWDWTLLLYIFFFTPYVVIIVRCSAFRVFVSYPSQLLRNWIIKFPLYSSLSQHFVRHNDEFAALIPSLSQHLVGHNDEFAALIPSLSRLF